MAKKRKITKKTRAKKKPNVLKRMSTAIAAVFNREDPEPTGKIEELPVIKKFTSADNTDILKEKQPKKSVKKIKNDIIKTTITKPKVISKTEKNVMLDEVDALFGKRSIIDSLKIEKITIEKEIDMNIIDSVKQKKIIEKPIKEPNIKTAIIKDSTKKIDKTVEELPVEEIVEVEKIVEEELPVEKIVEEELPVEKIVEVEEIVEEELPVEEIVEVEKIVEEEIVEKELIIKDTLPDEYFIIKQTDNITSSTIIDPLLTEPNEQIIDDDIKKTDEKLINIKSDNKLSNIQQRYITMTQSGKFEIFYKNIKIYDTTTCRFNCQFLSDQAIIDGTTYKYKDLIVFVKNNKQY